MKICWTEFFPVSALASNRVIFQFSEMNPEIRNPGGKCEPGFQTGYLTLFLSPVLIHYFGQVAQSVEQWTENPRVGSSILSLATIFLLHTRSGDGNQAIVM